MSAPLQEPSGKNISGGKRKRSKKDDAVVPSQKEAQVERDMDTKKKEGGVYLPWRDKSELYEDLLRVCHQEKVHLSKRNTKSQAWEDVSKIVRSQPAFAPYPSVSDRSLREHFSELMKIRSSCRGWTDLKGNVTCDLSTIDDRDLDTVDRLVKLILAEKQNMKAKKNSRAGNTEMKANVIVSSSDDASKKSEPPLDSTKENNALFDLIKGRVGDISLPSSNSASAWPSDLEEKLSKHCERYNGAMLVKKAGLSVDSVDKVNEIGIPIIISLICNEDNFVNQVFFCKEMQECGMGKISALKLFHWFKELAKATNSNSSANETS